MAKASTSTLGLGHVCFLLKRRSNPGGRGGRSYNVLPGVYPLGNPPIFNLCSGTGFRLNKASKAFGSLSSRTFSKSFQCASPPVLFPSHRQHPSYDDCLEVDWRETYHVCVKRESTCCLTTATHCMCWLCWHCIAMYIQTCIYCYCVVFIMSLSHDSVGESIVFSVRPSVRPSAFVRQDRYRYYVVGCVAQW